MHRPTTSRIARFTALVALAGLSLGAALQATAAPESVRAQVPFAFKVGRVSFEPGTYLVSMPKSGSGTIIIRSADGGGSAIALAHKTRTVEMTAPVLTFNAYGETRFLSVVGLGGTEALALVRSPEEIQVAGVSAPPAVARVGASQPVR